MKNEDNYLTAEERKRLLDSLPEEQRIFLQNNVKKRVRSKFANKVATDKWELIDYIDAGQVTPGLRCKCGRALRYQYIVKDLQTNEIIKLGKNHFEQHTGIPTYIAKEVVQGIQEIHYELDEILVKIRDNFELPKPILHKLEKIEVDEEIKEFLHLGLPLSERALNKILRMIKEVEVQNEVTREHFTPTGTILRAYGQDTPPIMRNSCQDLVAQNKEEQKKKRLRNDFVIHYRRKLREHFGVNCRQEGETVTWELVVDNVKLEMTSSIAELDMYLKELTGGDVPKFHIEASIRLVYLGTEFNIVD